MKKYVLSLDQGTTSSRAIIFDKIGNIISVAQREFTQIYPYPGWVEHNAEEIWSTQASVALEAILKANLEGENIVSIGITNQRETTVVWDKRTGEPIFNAIVWQDRRTSNYCDQIKYDGLTEMIRKKTGLVIDPYFSATKIKWILENVPGARDKANSGNLAFGTIDSWLIWNLTGKEIHVTDVTNASRTMLFNIHTLSWDQDLINLFDIPYTMLPSVKSSSEIFGYTTGHILSHKIPISGIAGDQQAALFGQMCTKIGMVKNTYGTGCFMLMNVGETPVFSQNNLITTIAWKIKDKIQYALEGSVFIAGAVVQWLRDGLGLLLSSSEAELLASSVENTEGLYMVPAFSGLGAPYWDQKARGTIVGITRGTSSAHFVRAALESIAFQNMDVLKAMEADSGISIKELRVDGGATVNKLLMQFQSEILNVKVVKSKISELTAAGAAYLAGLAVNYWTGLEEIQENWKLEHIFEPKGMSSRLERIKGWKRAIKTTRSWSSK
ncbi:MAG: glycerol kinase GlpK [Flavobacteriales bacterium]|jgi:glycerol kinase|uniref:glycerol kinase GlpK n=1 Tax=Blattabacterium sp. (Mastotermes darwiniensis) TaxID=39768 RepID=UPI000231DDBF|nr:glycerol kinase GlpK [Blattabacterium sp. (Mastotermes darwiniensis)]AER40499.1 glycerol kinase [Blattabacterium sp. (Mastotermes darwiniensis) str. MADAR]MDR1804986.1 glycerol kinase GlpK [Flavobacteriales bacterium]